MADVNRDEAESSLTTYLRSPQGHEVATRVVAVIQGIQKARRR